MTIPHAWRQDVPVAWEGPAIYRTRIKVPDSESRLEFEGASFEAVVCVEGQEILTHRGMWTSFGVDLSSFAGRNVEVKVAVTKSGGKRFPVNEVAGGFLPFVFHTFGGVHKPVWLEQGPREPEIDRRSQPVALEANAPGRKSYLRGLLHWGWYPQLGHTNPPDEVIREEIRKAKELGFNCVKFCLWVPPKSYFRALAEEGMIGWLELPLWDPTSDQEALEQIETELKEIVDEYSLEPGIDIWTIGCELNDATPPEFRKRMVEYVRAKTGCPWIKDNSGGAEMYGGDLVEFGTFDDFHPYCDTMFFGPVLDSLLPGARSSLPILLGETNDVDNHRDVERLAKEAPFWTCNDAVLNDQGVRWQHDLPKFLPTCRFRLGGRDHEELMESSRQKALFMRKHIVEMFRQREGIAGYVLTGWRDTPISTAGFFDDWGNERFTAEEVETWNAPTVISVLANRRPPWIRGGNRPGWADPHNLFEGSALWKFALSSEVSHDDTFNARLVGQHGKIWAETEGHLHAKPLEIASASQLAAANLLAGEYMLCVESGNAINSWPIWVVPQRNLSSFELSDPAELFGMESVRSEFVLASVWSDALIDRASQGTHVWLFAPPEACLSRPFWRECIQEFRSDPSLDAFKGHWSRLLPISSDSALNPEWLEQKFGSVGDVKLNRIDTRTYQELPLLTEYALGNGSITISTLRPFGGLGDQPGRLAWNPAGCELLWGWRMKWTI